MNRVSESTCFPAKADTLDALELDHVLIAAADLAAAADEIETRHGLASIEGGTHPGWGTANRIVPLGDCYLELVAVVDEAAAAQNAFGTWVTTARSERAQLLGWAVRTSKLDAVADRLDLTIGTGSRATRAGQVLRWRLAGIEQAAAEPSLPFFIEWAHGTPFPGSAPARHPAGAVRIAELHVDGDAARLAAWLGAHDLPVAVRAGRPGIASIVLAAAGGEIRL